MNKKPTKSFKCDMNLPKLIEQFGSDEKCRAQLASLRWPKGVTCPRCQSKSVSNVVERDQYDCNTCRYQFSVTSGTIFHDTHLPLSKWFLAIYLMTESKKGMSALQIKRTINVSYETAWYLCHRIRAAMRDINSELLRGIVEVDETYVGGKVRGRGRGYKGNKEMVLVAVQRGGQIRLKVDKRADRATLRAFIKSVVDAGAEAIYTD